MWGLVEASTARGGRYGRQVVPVGGKTGRGECPPPEELLICCAGPLRDMLTRGKGGADSSKDKGPSDGSTCLEPPHPPHHARAATPPPQRHPLMLFVRAPICLPLCACAGEKGEKGGADSSEDKETPEIGSDGRSDGIGVNPDDVSTPLGSKSAGAADPGPGPWTPNFMGEFLKKSFQEALETLCDALERRLENGQQRVLDAMCRRTAGLMVKAQVDELAKLMATLIRIHGAMQTRTDTSIALRQLQAAVGSAMQAIAPAVAQPASAQPSARALIDLGFGEALGCPPPADGDGDTGGGGEAGQAARADGADADAGSGGAASGDGGGGVLDDSGSAQ